MKQVYLTWISTGHYPITQLISILVRMILGLCLFVPGLWKLWAPRGLDQPLDALGLLTSSRKRRTEAVQALGIAEVLAGLVCLVGMGGQIGAIATTAMCFFLLMISIALHRVAPTADCGCFPPGLVPPVTVAGRRASIVRVLRNLVFLVMAASLIQSSR